MGKSLSQENAAKVASNFHLVLTAFDNDRYGREATEKISATLFGSKARDHIVISVGAMVIPEVSARMILVLIFYCLATLALTDSGVAAAPRTRCPSTSFGRRPLWTVVAKLGYQ